METQWPRVSRHVLGMQWVPLPLGWGQPAPSRITRLVTYVSIRPQANQAIVPPRAQNTVLVAAWASMTGRPLTPGVCNPNTLPSKTLGVSIIKAEPNTRLCPSTAVHRADSPSSCLSLEEEAAALELPAPLRTGPPLLPAEWPERLWGLLSCCAHTHRHTASGVFHVHTQGSSRHLLLAQHRDPRAPLYWPPAAVQACPGDLPLSLSTPLLKVAGWRPWTMPPGWLGTCLWVPVCTWQGVAGSQNIPDPALVPQGTGTCCVATSCWFLSLSPPAFADTCDCPREGWAWHLTRVGIGHSLHLFICQEVGTLPLLPSSPPEIGLYLGEIQGKLKPFQFI